MSATVVGIVGDTGSGKTTSLRTLDPKTSWLINPDGKMPAFPEIKEWVKEKHYTSTWSLKDIETGLDVISKNPKIKVIVIDTITKITERTEMSPFFQNRKAGNEARARYNDLAVDTYNLITKINDIPRDDLIIYLTFNPRQYTDIYGDEKLAIGLTGQKLDKIMIETLLTTVLFAKVKYGEDKNDYIFETRAFHTTAKSPMGMFADNEIPNDLGAVDKRIREFYGLEK